MQHLITLGFLGSFGILAATAAGQCLPLSAPLFQAIPRATKVAAGCTVEVEVRVSGLANDVQGFSVTFNHQPGLTHAVDGRIGPYLPFDPDLTGGFYHFGTTLPFGQTGASLAVIGSLSSSVTMPPGSGTGLLAIFTFIGDAPGVVNLTLPLSGNVFTVCGNSAPSLTIGCSFEVVAALPAAPLPNSQNFLHAATVAPCHWTFTSSNASGRIRFVPPSTPLTLPASDPFFPPSPGSGQPWLVMDASMAGTLVTNEATFRIDPSPGVLGTVSYWFRETNDENHPEDGLFITDGTAAPVLLRSHQNPPAGWNRFTVNAGAIAAAAGLNPGGPLDLIWRHRGNDSVPNDGHHLDDIEVLPAVLAAATMDYGVRPPASAIQTATWPAFTVRVLDLNRNPVTSFTGPVTISKAAGSPAGTLGGTLTRNAVAGVATLNDVSFSGSGTVVLDAAAIGLGVLAGAGVAVGPGPPTRLAYGTAPAAAVTAGTAWPAFQVRVVDAIGNLVTAPNFAVTVTPVGNSGPITGTLTRTTASGVATFSGLAATLVQSFTLDVSAPGITGITGTPVTVNPGTATALAYVLPPASPVVAGSIWAPFQVRIRDSSSNTVISATNTITVARLSGTGALMGTTSRAAAAGIAVFDDISYTVAQSMSVRASATGLSPTTSPAIAVQPAAPSVLTWNVAPPAAATAGAAWTTFSLRVRDAFNNTVTAATNPVTVGLAGGGPLNGTATQTPVNGIVSFSGISTPLAGTHTVQVSSPGLAVPAAVPITVGAAAPSTLSYGLTPGSTSVAGATWPVFSVRVLDAFSNLVTGATATIGVALPPGVGLNGTTVRTPVQGVAVFDDLSSPTAGAHAITVTSTGLPALTGSMITITPGAAHHLDFGTPPVASFAAGPPWPLFTVRVEDSSGNLVPSATHRVDIALAGGAGVLTGALYRISSGGISRFTNMAYNLPETITLDLSSPGLAGISGTAVTLLPLTAHLASLSPATLPRMNPASAPVTLSITGSGFVPQSTAFACNQVLPTTYLGPTQLQAVLGPSVPQTREAGAITITVANPPGYASNTLALPVEITPGVVGDNAGTVVELPLAFGPGVTFNTRLEGCVPGPFLYVFEINPASPPSSGIFFPTANMVLGVNPLSPNFIVWLDGLGAYGSAHPLGHTFQVPTSTPPFGLYDFNAATAPSPPLGITLAAQALYPDPGSPVGYRLTWPLTHLPY